MSVLGIGLTVVAALLTVVGNLLMRHGVVLAGGLSLSLSGLLPGLARLARQPLFDVGVVLYGVASLVWFRLVSTENLNSSYPLLVSLTFLFVTIGATLLFKEPISLQKVLGLAVILGGIVLVASAK